MEDPDFRAARSRVSAEIKMFIIEIRDLGLDSDTEEFVSDGASRLISELDQAVEDRELERVESGLGRLQMTVRQALKRGRA